MGRPRKPTHLKLLDGNPGKRPLPENEPKPMPIRPDMPKWLNKHGKKMWEELAEELERLRLLTRIDGQAFAAACQNWGIFVDCELFFKKSGRVMTIQRTDKNGNDLGEYSQARPEVAISNSALKLFKGFCAEFGLTPSSRAGINLADADADDTSIRKYLSG